MLDSERIARETFAHSLLPKAFKRAGQEQGPDEQHQLLALWNNRRRSILTSRQHLVGEAEYLLCELPLELREQLPDTKAVKPRLAALDRRNRRRRYDAPTKLRMQLLDGYRAQIKALDLEEKQVVAQLDALVDQSGSTLGELCGLNTRSVAELLVEVGDPRRFTEGGFARFNGSAPLPASTGEGPGEPVRHRYNPGGNRRINSILHRMAVTQLRCEPRAQRIYANARANGHTKKEARRILKRHLSDVIYRRMIRDLAAADQPHPPSPSSLHNRARRGRSQGWSDRAERKRAAQRQSLTAPRRAPHSGEERAGLYRARPNGRAVSRHARRAPYNAPSATWRLPIGAFSPLRTSTPQSLPLDIGAFVARLARFAWSSTA